MRKLALLILFVTCQVLPSATRAALAPIAMTPVPTHTPRPLFASSTPAPPTQVLPPPTNTSLPTLPPLVVASSPAGIIPTWTPPATWTPPPPNPAEQRPANFVFGWAIRFGWRTVARAYAYGGTNNGRLQVHRGLDLVNPTGTPIRAAADGTVIFAGNDLTTLVGPYNNYYGNVVVIQHNILTPEGLPLFSLYGHMSSVTARAGQYVREGDVIGLVGETGIALGPHLHFEVRVGSPFDFTASRNPELWLRPPDGTGLLAGRVVDGAGRLLYGETLTVANDQAAYHAYSYGDSSVNSDPMLGENFTLGALPAGYYVVTVANAAGLQRFARTIYIFPGAMTWLDVQLPS